jgi:hypothetical protein
MARRIITSIKYSRKIILYNYIEETQFKSLSNSLNDWRYPYRNLLLSFTRVTSDDSRPITYVGQDHVASSHQQREQQKRIITISSHIKTHPLHCKTFSLHLTHQADRFNALRCSSSMVAVDSNLQLAAEQSLTSIKGDCHKDQSSAQFFSKPEIILQALWVIRIFF